MKRILITIIMLVCFVSTAATVYAAKYTDMTPSHWAYETVGPLSEASILNGYPDGTFRPNNTVTEPEFIKMLIVATDKDFKANPEVNWVVQYLDEAVRLGYVTTSFRDYLLTNTRCLLRRDTAAELISPILGNVNFDESEVQTHMTDVTDNTADGFEMMKAYAAGIMTGYPDGTFQPAGNITRAEAATIIYRLINKDKRVQPGAEDTQSVQGAKMTIYGWAGDSGHEVVCYDAKLGDNGIVKISYTPKDYKYYKNFKGDVWVYSTIPYSSVSLYIDNGEGFTMLRGVIDPDTTYYYVDGYYVYDVYYSSDHQNKAHPIDFAGKTLILGLSGGYFTPSTYYKYIDATL